MDIYKEGDVIAFKILTGDVYAGKIAIRWTDAEGGTRYCTDGIDGKVYNVTPDRVVLKIENEMIGTVDNYVGFNEDEYKRLLEGVVKIILELRQAARRKRAWAIADEIRDRLAELGFELEDTLEGTHCKRR